MRYQLERVGSVALAAGLLWAMLAVQPHHLLHTYHDQNAGVVAWDCGPGLEVVGQPGFFMEQEC